MGTMWGRELDDCETHYAIECVVRIRLAARPAVAESLASHASICIYSVSLPRELFSFEEGVRLVTNLRYTEIARGSDLFLSTHVM